MSGDFVASARLRPHGGFAVRRGISRWALRVATERRDRPVGIALRHGPRLSSRWYGAAGNRLHVRVSDRRHDRATPVVLVHGVIVSSRYLLPAAAELAGDFAVVVPDLPGYGLSSAPATPPDLATLADAAIESALAAGYERVSLVGNSFGAQIVVEAALRHPERVERIALLAPTVDPGAWSLMRQYLRWQRAAPDEHPSSFALMARDLLDVGVVRAARLLRVMLDDAIDEKLPQVASPALVVRGGRDRVVPAEWALRATDLLPRGELAVVPGYAHMAHYSGVLAVVPVLRRFLLDGAP